LIFAVTKPLGVFMVRVFSGERTFLDPALRPIERLLYRVTGVDEKHEMRWTEYAISMLLFSGVSMLLLYLISACRDFCLSIRKNSVQSLPLILRLIRRHRSLTNTNWQEYAGETTMSYFTQMAGLAFTTSLRPRPALYWLSHLSAASLAGRWKPSEISGSILFAAACGCFCHSVLWDLCF
jgi:K+-transporting ATPase ATPase A chain